MSAQLESQHFFRIGDQVRSLDGRYGEVLEGFSLYASIRWDDGTMKEIDQFDPEVTVIERQQEG